MKRHLQALLCLATLSLASCQTPNAQQSQFPTLRRMWAKVGQRVALGTASVPGAAEAAKQLDAALIASDRVLLRDVTLGPIEDAAAAGLQLRVQRAEIDPAVADYLGSHNDIFFQLVRKVAQESAQ